MNLQIIKQLWKKATQQDLILTQATALAYTSVVSIVPVLAVAFFLFKAFGGFESLEAKLEPLIEQNLAPAFSEQLWKYIDAFVENVHAGTMGVFGLVGFIFTSVSTLSTIETTFNRIWGVNKQRTFAKRVTTYWSLLTIGPLFFALSIGLSSKAILWLEGDTGEISKLLVWSLAILPYLISGALFSALYAFMPNVHVDFRDAVKAGGITGFVFEIAKIVYATYATNVITHNSIYGSMAIIPLFLLWIYVIWLIVLFGAELCCYFQFQRSEIAYKFDPTERINPLIIMDITEKLSKQQIAPGGGMTIAELLGALKIPLKELTAHLDFLEAEGWVVAGARNFRRGRRYYLAVNRTQVDVGKLLHDLDSRRYVPKSKEALEIHEELKSLWAQWGRGHTTSKS